MLLLLVTGQRGQTVHMLNLSCVTSGKDSYSFVIADHVKQSQPGTPNPLVNLFSYEDISICSIFPQLLISNRAASVSAASRASVNLDVMLDTAGWSSECCFARYYNKPIVQGSLYAHSVLSAT